MSDDIDKFRKRAEEAKEHADRSVSPLDKKAWLQVAEEWLKLAAVHQPTFSRTSPIAFMPAAFLSLFVIGDRFLRLVASELPSLCGR